MNLNCFSQSEVCCQLHHTPIINTEEHWLQCSLVLLEPSSSCQSFISHKRLYPGLRPFQHVYSALRARVALHLKTKNPENFLVSQGLDKLMLHFTCRLGYLFGHSSHEYLVYRLAQTTQRLITAIAQDVWICNNK